MGQPNQTNEMPLCPQVIIEPLEKWAELKPVRVSNFQIFPLGWSLVAYLPLKQMVMFQFHRWRTS